METRSHLLLLKLLPLPDIPPQYRTKMAVIAGRGSPRQKRNVNDLASHTMNIPNP